MEIERRPQGDVLELRVTGRLDAMWAEHLLAVVTEAVREGSLRIRADLSGVVFLSSAGIGALVQAYRELAALHGAFWISTASDRVKKSLELVGLLEMLTKVPEAKAAGRILERDGATFHVTDAAPPPAVRVGLHGDPSLLVGCRFGPGDTTALPLTDVAFSVGVGALGETFADSRDRFGELLSVGDAAMVLPTDGSGAADFVLAAPEIQLLYGLSCSGPLSSPTRFEGRKGGSVRLGEVADAALELAGSESVALVVIGEPAGLVGAALRRSPATGAVAGAPFDFPDVRRWLSFTSESGGGRRTLLVAGVVTREPGRFSAFVRPFTKGTDLLGHLHGATFSLRHAPSRATNPAEATAALFESGSLRSVLHLLADDREGETELVRGTLWWAPFGSTLEAGS
jgi:anti-anti-sigma factor